MRKLLSLLIGISALSSSGQPCSSSPSGLEMLSYGATTITLDWSSAAGNFQIRYTAQGTALPASPQISSSSSSATITGLSPNTEYLIQVRDSCGSSSFSNWSDTLQLQTACSVVSAPFTAAFDGPAWVPASTQSDGAINSCWQRNQSISPSEDIFWTTGPVPNAGNWGAADDHSIGTAGQYALVYRPSFNFFLDTAIFRSPLVDLSSLNVPEISFWYHLFGVGTAKLDVAITRDQGQSYTLLDSLIGPQQNSSRAPWKEKVIDLSAYSNDTVRLRFRAIQTSSSFSGRGIGLDDLSFRETPTCPRPDSLEIVSTDGSSVTLDWVSGGASNWEIRYGSNLTNPSSGTLVSASSRPFSLNGLNPNTSYKLFVRDSCGPGDVSLWVGPLEVRTRCLPVKAPYQQDFEGSNVQTGNFSSLGSIPGCWRRGDQAFLWDALTGSGLNTQSGPAQDHSPGGSNYLATRGNPNLNGTNSPSLATVQSVPVDLDSLSQPRLTFWYFLYGSDIDSLALYLETSSGEQYLWSETSPQQNSPNQAWLEQIIDLSSYLGDTIVFKWKAYRSPQSSNFNLPEIALDDISVTNAPSCPKPQNLQVTSRDTTSLTIDWTSGGANQWQIEYGFPGFSLGNGTRLNVSSKPYTISGLDTNSSYEIYLRDSCGASDLSDWSFSLTTNTKCGVKAAPYLEDFEGGAFQVSLGNDPTISQVSPCWSRSDSANFLWATATTSPTQFTGPDQDHTSGSGKFIYSARDGFSFFSDTLTTITTEKIDLSPLTNPQLRFFEHRFGSNISRLKVAVSTGNGWTDILNRSGANLSASTDPWTEQVASLSAYANDTIRLRFESFRVSSFSRAAIGLDDIEVREAPSCPRPQSLSATAISSNSVQLNWTTGGASQWQIQYRAAGTNNTQILTSSSNPFTLTGLNPATTYYIAVRDSCGPGDLSVYTDSIEVRTNCGTITAPYLETFDGSSWVIMGNPTIDPCWSNMNRFPDFRPNRSFTTSTSTGPNQDAGSSGGGPGGKYIYTEASGSNGSQGSITSPSIYLPSNLIKPYLRYAYHLYGVDITSFEVKVSRNGGNFTNLNSFNGPVQSSNAAPWQYDSLDLSNYRGDTIQIRFINNFSSYRADAAVDNFQIDGIISPCAQPNNLQLTALSPREIRVSWDTNNVGPSSFIRYWPLSQGPSMADTLKNASSPDTLSQLMDDEDYRIEVIDSCTSGFPSAPAIDTISTPLCPAVSAAFSDSLRYLGGTFLPANVNPGDSTFWRLGNGDTSKQRQPAVSYDSAGTYQVTLEVSNSCGNFDSLTQSITVCDTIVPDFTYSVTGDSVVFNASATANASIFRWDLDEGKTGRSRFPIVEYDSLTTKSVTLTAINACGDTARLTQQVEFCGEPKADFTFQTLPPINSGLRLQFDATLSQNATSYQWQFGDGNSATGPNPIHVYSTPGFFYEVTLIVSNECGFQDTLKIKLNQVSLREGSLKDQIDLYPNPAQHQVTLSWSPGTFQIQSLELIDNQGKLVRRIPPEGDGEQRISLAQYASGTYFLRITTKDSASTLPLVIRR